MAQLERPWKFAGPAYGRSYRRLQDTCDVCHNLNLERVEYENWNTDAESHRRTGTSHFKYINVKIDYFALAESAELEDCIYCSLIFQALSQAGASISYDGFSVVTVHAQKDKPFFLSWDDTNRGPQYLEIFFSATSTATRPIETLGTVSEIATNAGDDSVICKILNWIMTCDETHGKCSSSPTSYPKRLLDVGESEKSVIKLVEDEQPGRYVALSHCWGGVRSCITTTDNRQSRKTQIDWKELPRTFQDAITLIRQLGVQYIWIDSLCIIQNDVHDWELESVRMGQIYKGAYFTIAAALAPDDEAGFLNSDSERTVSQGNDLHFHFQGESHRGFRFRETHDVRHHNIFEPLSTRGWTLQERLLSTRVLTFTSGVSLECATTSFCECGHSIYANPLYPGLAEQDRLDRIVLRDIMTSGSPENQSIYEYWYQVLVRHYSTRRLTKDSDRLPAIHSLAMLFSEKLNDEYISGLWKGSLLPGLNWRNVMAGESTVSPRPSDIYRAPSWSWASIESAVFSLSLTSPACSIAAIGHDDLNNKYLILNAPLIKFSLRMELLFHDNGDELLDVPHHGYSHFAARGIRFDTPVEIALASTATGEKFSSLARSRQNLDRPEASGSVTIFALLLGRTETSDLASAYLVLGGRTDPPGSYQRIGHALVTHGSFWRQSVPDRTEEMPTHEVTIY